MLLRRVHNKLVKHLLQCQLLSSIDAVFKSPGPISVSSYIAVTKVSFSFFLFFIDKQLRVVEEYKKYHITSFLSGGVNQPVFPGETDVVNFTSIPESIAEFYPEMNATNIYKTVEEAIKSGEYKFIAANFANIDCIGHSGNTIAVILECEN
jgi:hypothetical protein